MAGPRDAAARWRRAAASLSPDLALIAALEIRHPDVPEPVRVVNDLVERVIEGARYTPLRWEPRLVSDVEGEAPHAEIEMDNVGAPLTGWVHASRGGSGATVRVLDVSVGDEVRVEWELTLRVHSVTIEQQRVRARLGYVRLSDRPVASQRLDESHAPGLF